jgi:hypothetical protein
MSHLRRIPTPRAAEAGCAAPLRALDTRSLFVLFGRIPSAARGAASCSDAPTALAACCGFDLCQQVYFEFVFQKLHELLCRFSVQALPVSWRQHGSTTIVATSSAVYASFSRNVEKYACGAVACRTKYLRVWLSKSFPSPNRAGKLHTLTAVTHCHCKLR